MSTATLFDLERDPLALLRRAEAGESILVTRDNRPVAELRPVVSIQFPQQLRPFGLAAGQFVVPDDFDTPLPEEVLAGFEGQ